MPTWAKVALVATGVVVVVAVVALIAQDDEEDAWEARDCDCDDHHRHHHCHDRSHENVVVVDGDDSGPSIYTYAITVRLTPLSAGQTALRVSGQGTRRQGDAVEQAGPIYDPEFFEAFHTRVQDVLALRAEAGR